MLLVIDNYDSFTWNLVQLLGELGGEPRVVRNDEVTVKELRSWAPDRIVVSPGPCTPAEAGISVDVFRELGPDVPILGVCLGHQALGEAWGGRTVRASCVMHGKTAPVSHTGEGLFRGIPSPFSVARYHSLVSDPATVPDVLEVVAWSGKHAEIGGPSEDGVRREIQGMRHREHPSWGVQFHPESLFSEHGSRLLANFLRLESRR